MKNLAILLFILVCLSCKKSKNEQQTDLCNTIVEALSYKPYPDPHFETTATFTYDAKGRLTSVKGNGLNKTEYAYYSDRIESKATDINGMDISLTYVLDNAGRITGTNFFDSKYTYNSDGYLISYRQPFGNNGQILGYTQYYLTYANGNLTEVSTPDPNVSRKKVTLEYHPGAHQEMMGYNSPLYLSQCIGDRNTFFLIKGGYFGKQSKSLLKSLDFHQGYPVSVINYEYDSKGRLTVIKEGYTFKYQCP
jgi:YD repeat-containing protein